MLALELFCSIHGWGSIGEIKRNLLAGEDSKGGRVADQDPIFDEALIRIRF